MDNSLISSDKLLMIIFEDTKSKSKGFTNYNFDMQLLPSKSVGLPAIIVLKLMALGLWGISIGKILWGRDGPVEIS